MAPRKHPRYDLERRKPVFLRIGYIIALATALTAFEWKCHSLHVADEMWMGPDESADDQDQIPQTIQEYRQRTVEPIQKNIPSQPASVAMTLTPVPDNVPIANTPDFPDVGFDTDDAIRNLMSRDEPVSDDIMWVPDEQYPQFGKGPEDVKIYIDRNLHYPPAAKQIGIKGIVRVVFQVDELGNVCNAKVTRSIGGGCDQEALRVINSMPRWKSGRQRGRPVKVWMSQDIVFNLN